MVADTGNHRVRPLVRLALYFISSLGVIASLPVAADIYGFVDRNGVRNYTDIPSDPRAKLLWRDPNGPKGIEIPTQPYLDYFIPSHLDREIDAVAHAQTLDPTLLKAVIAIESRFNPRARSPKGAMGLMQLMPATAKRYGVVNAYDARQNLRGGARYLRDLMTLFNNDARLALAAFNAGENAVIRHGRTIPPYPETRHYVPAVLAQMALLRKNRGANRGLGVRHPAPLNRPRARISIKSIEAQRGKIPRCRKSRIPPRPTSPFSFICVCTPSSR